MSVEKAKAHYSGTSGFKKSNCAEAIAYAFQDKFKLSAEDLSRFVACGGGRAPGGVCGSLYAAQVILEKNHSQAAKDCAAALLARAGSIQCREIRALKKLPCVGCVEMVATHVDGICERQANKNI
ncbi:MAG: C-GCAxxG-C-C family protein [Candidatus Omnitrophica bacterium]|nr:C-GCAxxG-C-C family protein [Candidatus Omnitrophota bacterium]